MSGECLKDVWKVGRCLEGVWKVSGECLKGTRKVLGRCQEGVWRISGVSCKFYANLIQSYANLMHACKSQANYKVYLRIFRLISSKS